MHVAYIHPVFAAKQCVTAHHIGKGRFGLNVVSGNHNPDMYGIPAMEHDAAYDYTEEWVTIVKRIWNENAPFDYSGRYFDLKNVLSKPKPYGGVAPMLISAGHSHRGREFAMKHADALFTAITEMRNAREEVTTARAASPDGERVPVYGSSHLVCRPTRKEADEYYHYLVHELGDWTGMDGALARWLRDRTLPVAAEVDRLKEDGSSAGWARSSPSAVTTMSPKRTGSCTRPGSTGSPSGCSTTPIRSSACAMRCCRDSSA